MSSNLAPASASGLALGILWRGPLDSCNYGCPYCPFAKRAPSRENLDRDRAALSRFVTWVESRRDDQLSILFTPWGEALVHRWYRETLARLSHLPQVRRVAIQTNGSCAMDWTAEADRSRLALWVTYHPSEITHDAFVAKALDLRHRGVRFSVGAVAAPTRIAALEALRRALPEDVYLWANVQRPGPGYDAATLARLTAIDPLIGYNLKPHPSRGRACRTGLSVIAVDGDGAMRRCHFVDEVIGNLYEKDFARALRPRPCPKSACGCHIGYAHLEDLGLDRVYGEGLFERIPSAPPWANAT